MYLSLSLSIAISKEFSLLVCNCPFFPAEISHDQSMSKTFGKAPLLIVLSCLS